MPPMPIPGWNGPISQNNPDCPFEYDRHIGNIYLKIRTRDETHICHGDIFDNYIRQDFKLAGISRNRDEEWAWRDDRLILRPEFGSIIRNISNICDLANIMADHAEKIEQAFPNPRQYDLQLVDLRLPTGSVQQGHRVFSSLPGDWRRIAYAEVRYQYQEISEINRLEFARELADKPNMLNRDFEEHIAGHIIGPTMPEQFLEQPVLLSNNSICIKLKDSTRIGERYTIWINNNAVCDMYFYYSCGDNIMPHIIKRIIHEFTDR